MTKPIEDTRVLAESLPRIRLEVLERESGAPPGFLSLVRRKLIAHYPGHGASQPFLYDEADRRALDAVVIAPHFVHAGIRYVFLRSALRPPASLRDPQRAPIEEVGPSCVWELPAGLVEPEEKGQEGLRRAASRELLEETGFDCEDTRFEQLGPACFPTPAVIAERLYFFHVVVRPDEQGQPTLDGSPLEAHAAIVPVRLTTALEACRDGLIEDAKTELGLRRLAELELLGKL
ncbi:MAG: NUDIX domain-containing protein [Polyangiaceae bacterium]